MNFSPSSYVIDFTSWRWLTPAICFLIAFGFLLDVFKGRPRAAGETFANLVNLIAVRVIYGILGASAGIALFQGAYNLAPWHFPINIFSAAAVLVLVDFAYYCQHRCEHSIAFMWALHQVHHSGSEFNFSTSVRGSLFTRLVSWVFILPLVALGFSPALVLSCQFLNLSYQMAKHCDGIGSLGWADRVFGTPYNHRVHHGRMAACFGKNLGGMFLLWDRLFGTYAPGTLLQDYGIPNPPGTNNPVFLQTIPVSNLFARFRKQKGLRPKFRALFGPPGTA